MNILMRIIKIIVGLICISSLFYSVFNILKHLHYASKIFNDQVDGWGTLATFASWAVVYWGLLTSIPSIVDIFRWGKK